MGSIVSSLSQYIYYDAAPEKEKVKVMLFGPPKSGKSSVLHIWKTGFETEPVSTVGFNMERVECYEREFDLVFWDTGGGKEIEGLFRHYIFNSKAIVYVVDASDTHVKSLGFAKQDLLERYSEAVQILGHPVPLLVLANKQDRKGALPVDTINVALELERDGQPWKVYRGFPTSATTGDGLQEALEWLEKHVDDTMKAEICTPRSGQVTLSQITGFDEKGQGRGSKETNPNAHCREKITSTKMQNKRVSFDYFGTY